MACKGGVNDAPFDTLKSPDAATDKQFHLADAEMRRQQAVCLYHITNGEWWEIVVPRVSRLWVNVERSRGPIMRSEEVGTDDEILLRIKEAPPLHRVWPPVRHI